MVISLCTNDHQSNQPLSTTDVFVIGYDDESPTSQVLGVKSTRMRCKVMIESYFTPILDDEGPPSKDVLLVQEPVSVGQKPLPVELKIQPEGEHSTTWSQ